MTYKINVLLFLLIFSSPLFAQERVGEGVESRKEFIKIKESEDVKINLKYASKDNFMMENLYGEFTSCYLHTEAYRKLQKAIINIKNVKPHWKIILFDCLRPRSIQYKFWKKVKGTSEEPYVANPEKGSIHNFGLALDLSLLDENGNEVDMGTPFDDFSPLAEPIREEDFLKSGKLTKTHIRNRKILRKAMLKAGFIQRPNEWWHYDAKSSAEVKKKFKIVE